MVFLPRRVAKMAASLTRFARSAPETPRVEGSVREMKTENTLHLEFDADEKKDDAA